MALVVFLFFAIWIVSVLWIARDDDLPIVPSYFREAFWIRQMRIGPDDHRRYGARFVMFCVLQCCLIGLFSKVASTVSLTAHQLDRTDLAIRGGLLTLMMLAFVMQYPWVSWARGIRFRNQLIATCDQLLPIVKRFVNNEPLPETCKPAAYKVAEQWSAYHDWFPGVVPVVYVNRGSQTSVWFTLDWETFLVWRFPINLFRLGEELPFGGAGTTCFLFKSVAPLRENSDWHVVETELQCDFNEGVRILSEKY